MLRPLQILLIISWVIYYPERFPEVRVRNKLAQYPTMPLVITFEVNEDHPHPFYNTKFPRPLSRYGLLTQWSKDRGCAFSVLFLPPPTIFSFIRLPDICDSTKWYTCWYLVTMLWCTRPHDFYMHRSAHHITQGIRFTKNDLAFYLGRWCISFLWWRFGERDFQDLRKEKCPSRSVKDNNSDALFSITLFTPSDTVTHCNSEDLVTVFEAITAWEIVCFYENLMSNSLSSWIEELVEHLTDRLEDCLRLADSCDRSLCSFAGDQE